MTTSLRKTASVLAATLLAAAAACPAQAHRVKLKDLEIVHPSTLEPASPADKDMIVTMTIHNLGTSADRLIGAASDLAETLELADGPGSPAAAIELPAQGTVAFAKAGPHIVLHGIKEEMAGYATFPLKLTFEKAGTVEAEVLVEENDAAETNSSEPNSTQGDH